MFVLLSTHLRELQAEKSTHMYNLNCMQERVRELQSELATLGIAQRKTAEEIEQKIADARKDATLMAQAKLNDMQAKMLQDRSEYEGKLREDHYQKLEKALQNLHEKGNITTQTMRDMTMTLLGKVPALQSSQLSLDVTTGPASSRAKK